MAYELELKNNTVGTLTDIEIFDTLPEGFRYQKKSSHLDGNSFDDPRVGSTGRQLTFDIGSLAPSQVITLRYVVEVTVKAGTGLAMNVAQAKNDTISSNSPKAFVLVEQPFFNDRAFLMGRVLAGACGDQDALALEGVRIYMEDGTSVVTDRHGRWHIEGVLPGTHVLQLDTVTLGPRYKLQQCP